MSYTEQDTESSRGTMYFILVVSATAEREWLKDKKSMLDLLVGSLASEFFLLSRTTNYLYSFQETATNSPRQPLVYRLLEPSAELMSSIIAPLPR